MPALTTIQFRRGTSLEWATIQSPEAVPSPSPLAMGEIGYDTTLKKFKIGDGTSLWGSLDWATILPIEINEIIDDRVASLIVPGSNITTSYNDITGTLTINAAATTVAQEEIEDIVANLLKEGSNIDLTYNDEAGTLTIAVTGLTLSDIDISNAARDFLTTPTSDNLRALVTDETGTGSLVFSDNPTLNGASINGNLTVSGNGLVASNINDFDAQVRTNRLDQMAAPTAPVSLNSQKITNLATPTADSDAATKAYVDAARSGLDVKQSVRVATTTNITLSGTQTIDNVAVAVGDRVLVKDQSPNASENGIYVVSETSWTRAADADSDSEVTSGLFTFVSEGDTYADSGWVLTTNDSIVLGTTALTFVQFSGAGQITAGDGLVKNGNTINAVGTLGRIVVSADNIDLDTVVQTDVTGPPGLSFVVSVKSDLYGRITGVTTSTVQNATTTDKGVASFSDSNFDVTNGAVTLKDGGITNPKLVNSSLTIGNTAISLGSSVTALDGLTKVTSTDFIGNLTGNASTATKLETARKINGTLFNGTTDITIAVVDGGGP